MMHRLALESSVGFLGAREMHTCEGIFAVISTCFLVGEMGPGVQSQRGSQGCQVEQDMLC